MFRGDIKKRKKNRSGFQGGRLIRDQKIQKIRRTVMERKENVVTPAKVTHWKLAREGIEIGLNKF